MTFMIGGSLVMDGVLDAFWPVADTEIGRLGIMMANEGSYPENARALCAKRGGSGLPGIVSAPGDRERDV